jgi:hypothetical protein
MKSRIKEWEEYVKNVKFNCLSLFNELSWVGEIHWQIPPTIQKNKRHMYVMSLYVIISTINCENFSTTQVFCV